MTSGNFAHQPAPWLILVIYLEERKGKLIKGQEAGLNTTSTYKRDL